jgi:thiol-disulfide isomerase/thioredoxin
VSPAAVDCRELLLMGTFVGMTLGFCSQPIAAERQPVSPTTAQQQNDTPLLHGTTAWLNSPPLTERAVHGKVILIDFWTYTCVNWRRTLPYVRAWAEKYQDHGLIVIGVHTPEFSFEKNIDNVRRQTAALGIPYPVAVDSDYAVWRTFNNQYWPALYIADAQGRIRHHQFGEGGYEEIERVLQKLLEEAGNAAVPHELVSLNPDGAEAAADERSLKTPETYLGYEQAKRFASPGGSVPDSALRYAAPASLRLNSWALEGEWTIGAEAAALNRAGGKVLYRFHARDVNLIMRAKGGAPVRFRIRIDGLPPGAAHGLDTDTEGNGIAGEPRMYQLIRQVGPISDRTFEIEFLDGSAEVFDFTFG